jgi:hypothetical protein
MIIVAENIKEHIYINNETVKKNNISDLVNGTSHLLRVWVIY